MAMNKGTWAIHGLAMAMGLGVAVVFALGVVARVGKPGVPLDVRLNKGESLGGLSRRMGQEGLLGHPALLRLLAALRGDLGRVKAGEYAFPGPVNPHAVLDALISGRSQMSRFTVPEGKNLAEIAGRLEERGLGSGQRFLALAHDPAFIAKLALPADFQTGSLEGLVFPNTYFFAWGTREEGMLTQMVAEFRHRALPVLQAQAAQVGLSPYQALVMASVIEKETGVGSERHIISAAFHNRLRKGMKLESDPTTIYGIPNFNGNLTHKDLITPSAYNTYTIHGLPPTPITNPGLDAMRAAMAPAKSNALFFVGKGDGTHFFSADFKTHTRAVEKYQIAPARKARAARQAEAATMKPKGKKGGQGK